jgi:hypothetical protein
MNYLGVYIREKDGWHLIERGFDGRTAEDTTIKDFDFAERLMMALTIDWNRSVVMDQP